MFKIVEKRNVKAVHAIFNSRAKAERHLRVLIPVYVKRGYFDDKTLTPSDFTIVESYD